MAARRRSSAAAVESKIHWHPMKVFLPAKDQLDLNVFKKDSNAYFMDYTADPETIREVAKRVRRVVVLDHHKTAEERFEEMKNSPEGIPENVLLVLDMERSAATISWGYFNVLSIYELDQKESDQFKGLKRIYNYVEDGDLWRWQIPQSREFYAGINNLGIEFDPNKNPNVFQTLFELDPDALIKKGEEILKEEARQISAAVAESFVIAVPNQGSFLATIVSGTANIRSPLGNALAIESQARGLRGIGAVVYEEAQLGDHLFKVSLRSIKQPVDENAAAVAEQYGGGGHRNACSFNIEKPTFDSWRV
eukprot:Colp12_sorted_trinity150504_noHs@26419